MAPLPSEAPPADVPTPRPELSIVEASSARERACSECGRRIAEWKPVRRGGTEVILCSECAARPPEGEGCPTCAGPLRPADRFCGKCGTRIEYACPVCGAAIEASDSYCGACGTRVA
ncbi:MAG: hypothetical protein A3K66_06660 [Euryarchaeota archaeon RBG_16_67_27]|nr:MAG: hypothetical protein A3K66_06660 [Euryarchaeota archaeon RBG_16_67_27]